MFENDGRGRRVRRRLPRCSQPDEAPELWYDLLAGNPIDLDETLFGAHPLHFWDGSEPEPVNLLAERARPTQGAAAAEEPGAEEPGAEGQ